jgi:hypothetical protein
MSNTFTKVALALVLLTAPAASFARMAGEAGAGNVPISGIPPGPANIGGLNNVTVDPSGNWQRGQVAAAAAAAPRRPRGSAIQVNRSGAMS